MASLKPKQSNILGYNLFRITLIHISKYWPWQKIQIGALVQRRGGLTFFLKGGRALKNPLGPKKLLVDILPMNPDPCICIFMRIRVRIQEAKMLRIQQNLIRKQSTGFNYHKGCGMKRRSFLSVQVCSQLVIFL